MADATVVWVVGAPFGVEAGGGEWHALRAATGPVAVFGDDGAELEQWLQDHPENELVSARSVGCTAYPQIEPAPGSFITGSTGQS